MLTSTIKYNRSTDQEQTGSYNTEFLAALSAFGNRIMCRFRVDGTLYQSDSIRFVKRYSVVSLLKSVMYAAEIRIDGIHDLKDKVITDLQFGVSEDGINYYLVSFGSFTITDSPSDLAGGFTTLTAYDGMLAAMKNYTPVTYSSGETNYTYFCKVASAINLSVGSSIPSTGLMALSRISDVYTENNTYRDILDDYAEILGGCIMVKNGILELVKPGNPVMTLDAGNLINFAPKDPFPLIDNLIFTFEGSITYKKNEPETGTIIRIDDNGLIDTADVNTYMNSIWSMIRTWGAFIPVEADSHGYMLFEPCDVISFVVGGDTYRVVWQSNDISITQGIEETFSSDEPADRADDYFSSDEEHNFAVMVNNKLSSMVRQYEGGVLVSRYGQNIGALVNAGGSFDVVQVTWDGNTPTAGSVLARYGSYLMAMSSANNDQTLRIEDMRGASGKVQVTETLVCQDGINILQNYHIYNSSESSIVSVISEDDEDVTSTVELADYEDAVEELVDILTSDSFVMGKKYTVTYISDDRALKSYTFGYRTPNQRVGGSSLTVGDVNSGSGDYSFAMGKKNYNQSFDHTFLFGRNLKAARSYQVIFGQSNTADSSQLFILANKLNTSDPNGLSGNIFTIDENGYVIFRNILKGVYGRIYSDYNATYGPVVSLGIFTKNGTRISRITIADSNLLINGIEQYYKDNSSITFNTNYVSFAGHVNNARTTIRFTVPTEKDLYYQSAFTCSRLTGGFMGSNGYIQYTSGTATSYNTNWLSQCNVTVSKEHDRLLNVVVTLKSSGGTFANVTGGTPIVFVPSTGSNGGLVISCGL